MLHSQIFRNKKKRIKTDFAFETISKSIVMEIVRLIFVFVFSLICLSARFFFSFVHLTAFWQTKIATMTATGLCCAMMYPWQNRVGGCYYMIIYSPLMCCINKTTRW